MSSPFVFLTEGRKGLLVIYDYTVSLCAVVVNLIVLRSVINAKIHLTGYKYCLVSLGLSNLYLCCVNIAIFVIEAVRLFNVDSECWGQVFRSLQISGLIANLLNLLGMSVDHLNGILFPLAYNRLTKISTMRICLLFLWTAAAFIGSAELPLTTVSYLAHRNWGLGSDPAPTHPPHINCTNDTMGVMMINGSHTSPGQSLLETLGILDVDGDEELLATLDKEYGDEDDDEIDDSAEEPWASDSYPAFMNSGPTHRLDKLIVRLGSGPGSNKKTPLPFNLTSTTIKPSQNENGNKSTAQYNSCVMNTIIDALGHASETSDSSKQSKTWCGVYRNVPFMEYTVVALTLLCFSLAAICYAMIFKEVFAKTKSAKRNVRRLVVTTLLLLGTFAFCYLPFMTFELSMVVAMHFDSTSVQPLKTSWQSFMVVHNVFSSLLITSPLIQPIIYAARLSTVRKQIVRDLAGSRAPRCTSTDV